MKNTNLNFNIDLSQVEHSMSNIIQNNHEKLDNCKTVNELYITLNNIFNENNLNTNASNRLLNRIKTKRDFTDALMTIYNSYLYGSQLGTI